MQDWEHREELSVHFLLLGNVLLRSKVHQHAGALLAGRRYEAVTYDKVTFTVGLLFLKGHGNLHGARPGREPLESLLCLRSR